MTTPEGEQRRQSARVLLIDGTGRVLLSRCLLDVSDPAAGDVWCVPGGGVEPDESLSEAASRELREETGIQVEPANLGDVVAISTGYANVGWANGVLRDDYFVLRLSAPGIDTSGLQPGLERDTFVEHRWWTADDLATTAETIVPTRLATLLTTLIKGNPAHPVRLPWHH